MFRLQFLPSISNEIYISDLLSVIKSSFTLVSGFSVLGFRALSTVNQIWFYDIDLPGFRALPGFKAPFYGNGQSALNPGSTVFATYFNLILYSEYALQSVKFISISLYLIDGNHLIV